MMKIKNVFFIGFFLATTCFDLFLAQQNFRSFDAPDRSPIDFRLRMNESDCIRSGIDPFDICTGVVSSSRFYPLSPLSDSIPAEHGAESEVVGLYPPWSYSLYIPLSCLPRNIAWWLWLSVSILALFALSIVGWLIPRMQDKTTPERFLVSGAALSIGAGAVVDFWCGNCCLLMSVSLLALWIILRQPKSWREDIFGAVALSFMMLKPQTGLLFVIPLLIGRRVRMVTIAAVICGFASLYPALLCRTSPITLAIQSPRACAPFFKGCAIMPIELANGLCKIMGCSMAFPLALAAAVGVGLCIWLSWRMRKASWLVRLAIPAILSVSWTYAAYYNHCICWIVLVALTLDFLKTKNVTHKVIDIVSFFCVARGARYVVRALDMFGNPVEKVFPGFGDQFSWVCSFVAVVLALWIIGASGKENFWYNKEYE